MPKLKHITNVFEKTHGETFTFQAHDIHFETSF
jgi:hypothetical protein